MDNNIKVWFTVPNEAIKLKTEKAICLVFDPVLQQKRSIPDEEKCWLPSSKISIDDVEGGKEKKITIPYWLLESKPLILNNVQIMSDNSVVRNALNNKEKDPSHNSEDKIMLADALEENRKLREENRRLKNEFERLESTTPTGNHHLKNNILCN